MELKSIESDTNPVQYEHMERAYGTSTWKLGLKTFLNTPRNPGFLHLLFFSKHVIKRY
jgi:hypothetical protein